MAKPELSSFTKADAAAALALCEAATPEPWEWRGAYDDILFVAHGHFTAESDGLPGFDADRAFITDARTALPAAIKMLMKAADSMRYISQFSDKCEESDPCDYDNTCRIHKMRGEARRWLEEWERK